MTSPLRLNSTCCPAVTRVFLCLFALILLVGVQNASASIPGSIQSTLADGTTVNANRMPSKAAAYLNGGPQNESSAGLPVGLYYFQVTDPNGSVLLSTDDVTCRQVVVVVGTAGKGVIHGNPGGAPPLSCTEPAGSATPGAFHNNGGTDAANGGSIPIQLCAPSGCPAGSPDYLDTPNAGGEYKVWLISQDDYNNCGAAPSAKNNYCFQNGNTKTDNYKVLSTPTVQSALVEVCKFDDTNANGIQDSGEPFIAHWPITATGVDPSSGNPTASGTTVNTQTGDNGCVAFTYTGGVANHTITLTEGLLPGWTATAPAAGACTLTGTFDTADDTCMVSYSAGIPTITITVNQGDLINAPNFGNNNCGGPCQTNTLVVTKTANPSFTRTFKWNITKDVDKTQINTSGSATFNYTVTVTHDAGTDSNWEVTGTIRVGNPGSSDISGITVTDAVDDGGSCTVDTSGFNGTVAANSHVDLPYTCTYSSAPTTGTNTAMAQFASSPFTGTATFDFSTATPNLVDDCVDVTDTLGGDLGTVCSTDSSPKSLTYSKTFTDPAGTCTSHNNTATFTTDTTATTGSASKSVNDCVGADLTVTKTATPTFNSNITKSPNQTEFDTSSGSSVTITYTVTVTESGWQVGGNITVNNPNDWEDITANLSDAISGANCTVNGGTTSVLVNRSSSVTVPYTCTFASAPSSASGTNTATASWDQAASFTPDGSAPGTKGYTFATLTVTDNFNGGGAVTLGTISTPTATSNFTDPHTVNAPTATCTTFNNTASIVETSQTANASVKVCGASDLNVTKTAVPTFNSNIAKNPNQTEFDTSSGSSVTITYTVTVTESGWQVAGNITVNNPNDWEDITANLSDVISGANCTVNGGTTIVVVNRSSSVMVPYTCTFASAPSSANGTNTATASWTGGFTPDTSASGTKNYTFGTLTVTDNFNGGGAVTLGTISTPTATSTFTDPHTVSAPTATCTTFNNTAAIVETSQTANASVKVCGASPLTVSKTAIPAFNSNITKGVDNTRINTTSGGSATFNYTVTVTESGWNVTGAITVSNPNNWESITANVADTLPSANCSVTPNSSQVVPPSGTATWSYTCNFSSAPGATGTNTGTATWDATAAHTSTNTASGTAGYTFGTLHVTDSFAGALGTISAPAASTVFTYSRTITAPTATCGNFPNTATITETSQSSSQSVEVCGFSPPTVSKTAATHYNATVKKTSGQTSPVEGGGSTTLTYTITVTESGWTVSGNITVTNPNNWEPITVNLADGLSIVGGSCSISGGATQTVPASGSISPGYICTFASAPAASGNNTAMASWSSSGSSSGTTFIVAGSASSGAVPFAFQLLNVTDQFNGGTTKTLGSNLVPAASYSFNDSYTVTVAAGTCTSFPNVATLVAVGTPPNASITLGPPASLSVTVCNTNTGALTMGFWKNNNGQGIITKFCGGTGGTSGTSLMTFLSQFNPFKDDTATTCKAEATYVSNILSGATCSSTGNTCNPMLRAQMLATALDVYFSDPTLGGNQIGAFNNLGNKTPALGGVAIDLSKICDGGDGGFGGSCPEDARSVFGICTGANSPVAGCTAGVLGTTVLNMLLYSDFASSINGNPVATPNTGATWYKQIKGLQVLAKDAFDAINNQIAPIAPSGVGTSSF